MWGRLALGLTSLMLWSQSVGAQVDPAKSWSLLKTPNFDVIYEQSLAEVGRVFAQAAETAHLTLIQDFSQSPQRTILVVMDSQDSANGFATFFPYPMIVVYAALPQAHESIGEYGDWALELMIHEYAHILNMYPANGVYRPFTWIFGSLVRPNALLPRWYLEGLAVEMESRYGSYGRLRSTQSEAVIRALVKEDLLARESLDWINETSIDVWPFGARPYLFGSYMMQDLIEQGGREIIDDLNQVYSRRPPFLLSGPLERRLNMSYAELWQSTRQSLERAAQSQLKAIGEEVEPEDLGLSGLVHRNMRVSEDAKRLLYVATQRGAARTQVRVVSREDPKTEKFSKNSRLLFSAPGVRQAVWRGQSEDVVYDRLVEDQIYTQFRDLYLYDSQTRKSRRLTFGERASEAVVSPNGELVAYISQGPLRTQLMLRKIGSKSGKTEASVQGLIQAPLGVRLSQPEFLSDRELVFVMRDLEGSEGLYWLDLEGRQRRRLLSSYSSLASPRQTDRGLLVVSRHTGVSNVYLVNSQRTGLTPLTNVSTALQVADWDPHHSDLYGLILTGQGPRVQRLSIDPRQSPSPPQILPLRQMEKAEVQRAETVEGVSRSYSSWPYLMPRYLLPFVYPIEGGMLVQATTSGNDPLSRQAWMLSGSYDSISEEVSYALSYSNSMTRVNWSAFRSEIKEYWPSSQAVLTSDSSALRASFFPWGLGPKWRASLGFQQSNTQTSSQSTGVGLLRRQGPSVGLAYAGSFGWGSQSLQLQHQHFMDKEDFVSYDRSYFSYATVLSRWLPERHNLHPQLRASYAPSLKDGDLILGDKTINGNYLASLLSTQFLMRGYPSAGFIGRSMANINLEYNFPLTSLRLGYGLLPFFARDLRGRVFVDAVSLDGLYYKAPLRSYSPVNFSRQFYSSGGELILNSTLAYHLPMSVTFGLYYGFDEQAGGGLMPFLTLGIGALPGLSQHN